VASALLPGSFRTEAPRPPDTDDLIVYHDVAIDPSFSLQSWRSISQEWVNSPYRYAGTQLAAARL
jgi:hypothetical protein